jgi:hypothetical protein
MPDLKRAVLRAFLEENGFEQIVILGWSQDDGYKILVGGSDDANKADARQCAEKLTSRLGLPGKIEI